MVPGARRCALSEVGEDGLGDFLGQLPGADLPQRGGMDEVKVAVDEFGERVLGAPSRVLVQQIQVLLHLSISISSPAFGIRQIFHEKRRCAVFPRGFTFRPGSRNLAAT